jgi:CopG family nickel-responsive transcriptional regulator
MSLKRFGVSLEDDLLKKLDNLVIEEQFPNRSQAIRYLVKKQEVEIKWDNNQEVAGAIVLVFDHHKRDLQKNLTTIQHDFHHYILSSQHVHLDHDNCLETITVKGPAKKLIHLSDKLKAVKGVLHGDLVMTVI